MLHFAILSGPQNGSPKVLADTLVKFVNTTGNKAESIYNVKPIKRLLTARETGHNRVFWGLFKSICFVKDTLYFSRLRKMDAIIICDWTPNGFYKGTYDIKKLKKKTGNKPVLYYAVQYLMNSPTIVSMLKEGGHSSIERYDWHLTVSSVTEVRGIPASPWSRIGLFLKGTGLKPEIKKELLALIDFERPGFEEFRELQIKALKESGIPYIELEGQYTIDEIRSIYKRVALYFMQSREAYGVPIAECLSCGCLILTPDPAWPMSWRIDEKPAVHSPGTLPDCFVVYNDYEELKNKLIRIRSDYDLNKTPLEVFNIFMKYYPEMYEGDKTALADVIARIESKSLV